MNLQKGRKKTVPKRWCGNPLQRVNGVIRQYPSICESGLEMDFLLRKSGMSALGRNYHSVADESTISAPAR